MATTQCHGRSVRSVTSVWNYLVGLKRRSRCLVRPLQCKLCTQRQKQREPLTSQKRKCLDLCKCNSIVLQSPNDWLKVLKYPNLEILCSHSGSVRGCVIRSCSEQRSTNKKERESFLKNVVFYFPEMVVEIVVFFVEIVPYCKISWLFGCCRALRQHQ